MEEHRIIYGDQNLSYPSHLNYGKFILDKLLNFKEKYALIDGVTDEKITFKEMAQCIVNAASSLVELGVKCGDVVAICSENRIEFLITALAGFCSGATVTFINSAYSKDELIHSMKISCPKYMFLSPKTYKEHNKTMIELNIAHQYFVFGKASVKEKVIFFSDLIKRHVDIDAYKPMDFVGHAQTALILYSSGTTGPPKGAKLTHLNLITSSTQPCISTQDLVVLTIAPFANTVGIICSMDELVHGRTVVFLAKFNETVYLNTLQKYKAGMLLAVPPLIVLLCKSEILRKYDVSSVQLIYCGGATLDLAIIDEAKIKFPNLKYLLQGYGMTETSGALTEETETSNKKGSVGKIVAGNIIKIVDIETRKVLGPNQPGEVCVKGPVLFNGYIGKDINDDLDEHGFYKTGDIAYYDEDEYFYIVDRLKELIKYKTSQVAPSELEAVLLQHPAVKDVAVVGTPDPLAGELPTAFVVNKQKKNATEKELVDFVAAKVSPWKQLRGGVKFVKEIPKSPSGKILRRILRNSLSKAPSSKL